MRRVNKKIIILSIILASVFLNNSNIYASSATSTIRRSFTSKNQNIMQEGRIAIENSFKNNDYNLFIETIKKLNINDAITKDQFDVLVKVYNLFKENKQTDAIRLLQENKINPILMRFINNRPDLSDTQKESLKQASDLIKQGKTVEAKSLISSLGLSNIPNAIGKKINKTEVRANRDELKKAFDTARDLRKEGKIDEAKKVLRDAGVPDQIQDKIGTASTTNGKNKQICLIQSIKNLFIK